MFGFLFRMAAQQYAARSTAQPQRPTAARSPGTTPTANTKPARSPSSSTTMRELAKPALATARPCPEPLPTSRTTNVNVVAPSHSSVQFRGVGRFVPASKVDICNTSGVVVGDGCTLKTTSHYHAYQASLDLGPLLRPSSKVKTALEKLVLAPSDKAAIADLRRALTPPTSAQPTERQGQAEQQVAANADIAIRGSDIVQLGNGSTMRVNTRYTVEERIVPLTDLLMESDQLVTKLGEALGQTGSGSAASFACEVIRASGQVSEFEQLAQLPLDQVPETTLFSYWGDTQIANGVAALVGDDTRISESLKLDLPTLSKRSLRGDLANLRRVHGVVPVESRPSGPAANTGRARPPRRPHHHDVSSLQPLPASNPTPLERATPRQGGAASPHNPSGPPSSVPLDPAPSAYSTAQPRNFSGPAPVPLLPKRTQPPPRSSSQEESR